MRQRVCGIFAVCRRVAVNKPADLQGCAKSRGGVRIADSANRLF